MRSLRALFSVLLPALTLVLAAACKPPEARGPSEPVAFGQVAGGAMAEEAPAAAPPAEKMRREADAPGRGRAKKSAARMAAAAPADGAALVADEAESDDAEPSAPMRSWFPETLLFEPAVITDDAGRASVSVRVPDRLTTWRVLALAHSREGAQAGDVARFQSTLPSYVDVVIPPFLHVGDRVSLPVQVVNTTDAPVASALLVEVSGAGAARLRRALTVPALGSRTEFVDVVAKAPGTLTVRATLGAADAVERTLEVRPRGMPGRVSTGATLAAPRQLTLTLPRDVEEGSARVRLAVVPGALALLRAELVDAPARSTPADDAYLLALTGRARALATQLGATLDDDELRRLRLIATQRALRHARAPDSATAARFAEAALAHTGSPVLARLGERLAAVTALSQRPDGTFSDGEGWTLPRLLVATATGLRAVRAGGDQGPAGIRTARATLLASGAFERHASLVEDGYTAAAILASGAVSTGALRERLIAIVLGAIEQREDGARVSRVSGAAQRADGARPSELEATALAVLALDGVDDAKAVLPDLGAALLSGYRGGRGFGDGDTNRLALEAVARLFSAPLPSSIDVALLVDGEPLVSGKVAGEALQRVSVLTAALDGGGARRFDVRATPPVPGLGVVLEVRYTSPWPTEAAAPGLELVVELPRALRVGAPAAVTLTASAPGGMALEVRHALPAGVQPDVPSLEALASEGVIDDYRLEEGAVVLEAPSRSQGSAFVARYRVIPTLAGSFHASASSVAPRGTTTPVYVASPRWEVAR